MVLGVQINYLCRKKTGKNMYPEQVLVTLLKKRNRDNDGTGVDVVADKK